MINLSDIAADTALQSLLEGKVFASSKKIELKVYAQYEMPNQGIGNYYIRIYYNGSGTSVTKPRSIFKGNLAVSVCVVSNTDGTAKKEYFTNLVSQVESLISEKTIEKGKLRYFFELTTTPITPITVNTTTGYASTVLNVAYRAEPATQAAAGEA
jgi:hypothetical protein